MTTKLLFAGLWIALALWAVARFTAVPSLPADTVGQREPAIVAADCGPAPSYDHGPKDAWYEYGDCSGDYGPIDAEGVSL